MKKADLAQPLQSVSFRCTPCRRDFSCAPARLVPAPDCEHHPWEYFAACPDCGEEAAQAAWERGLLKAWTKATGPRTPEGKAASAQNLAGHPTPEEAQRTRFNAMKHGLTAKTATYFPARPDGYAWCKSCDVDRLWCANQPCCVQQTRNFMLHHAAFEQRNPKLLSGMYSELHAAILATVQQLLQTIINDGVKLETPEWYQFEGVLHIAEYFDEATGEKRVIKNIEAHPLFKPLSELLTRVGLTLADMGMTTKVIEDENAEMGRLEGDAKAREALTQFAGASAKSLAALEDLVKRAQTKTDSDPLLIEHAQQEGS